MKTLIFNIPLANTLPRSMLALTVIVGALAVPLLCLAGTAEHACACDSNTCCDEESLCELDPCDALFRTEVRQQAPTTAPAPSLLPLIASQGAHRGVFSISLALGPPRTQWVPPGDLPLRI